MVKQVGPRIRDDASVGQYLANLSSRPQVDASRSDKSATPGYVQKMQGIEMSDKSMKAFVAAVPPMSTKLRPR
ncbi:hypothetical protein UC8_32770 [Roseimaritima ulvae]|uniref:Uncharacterized protein n=2 Tax=Roseimaritima ulvae TaxID=980254 RepID=A0A5B9QQH3_9BACT|nr:hypothetical protein UC8_32770 [Roseimaritima ulvae]